jgi:hypothetical protein
LYKTIIKTYQARKFPAILTRRQESREDINILMKKLTSKLKETTGGCHNPANCEHFRQKNKVDFLKKLKSL